MEIHIHVHHHGQAAPSSADAALTVLAEAVKALASATRTQGDTMTAAMKRLTDEVQQSKEVTASAVALLGGLSQQIRDVAGDEDAANKLADDLDANTKSLADAVTANTPAAAPADPSAANGGSTGEQQA